MVTTDSERQLGRKHDDKIRRKILATLGGSVLLLFSLVVAAVFSYLSFQGPREALADLSNTFRAAEAELMSERVALIIRPAWTVCRQFVDRLRTGSGQDGFAIIPPSPATFAEPSQLLAYTKALAPYFNKEVYMRSTTADMSEYTHNMFVGITMVLALDANNTPATSASCSKAVLAATHLNATSLDSYYVVSRYLDANATETAGQTRAERRFDIEGFQLGEPDFSVTLGDTGCVRPMRALWDATSLDAFYNFTWHGPFNPNLGWGNHLLGSVPIYNDRQEQVGRFSVPISMGRSIGPGLARILEESEKMSGGIAALYTESRLVLGLSELRASPTEEQAANLDELVPDSRTARAVAAIEQRFGEACPAGHHFLTTGDADDALIDITTFLAEEHGMPPLPERWCQIVMLPRDNIYKAIDDVSNLALFAAISCGIGFVGAIASFLTSLILAIRVQKSYKAELLDSDMAAIQKAEESMSKLASPMVIISAGDFLATDELHCYEDWRDQGKLVYLDSIKAANNFREAGNLIVFISHQWLGWHHPDCDNVQLRVMHNAVKHFVATEARPVYIWLDFISIAQRHERAQALAVAALPVYVSLVDRFVICAPDARHKETHAPVGLASYSQRGWCRAEMLAKACSSGIQNMFICAGEHGEMRQFAADDMGQISLSVYEGDFTVKRDAEKLVVPILGLYSRILRQSDKDHMQSIRQYIDTRKESFFPVSYTIVVDGQQETRNLFGHRIELLEQHVARSIAE